MLTTTLASLAGAMLFLAAMLYATVSDLRTRRIPNWLVGALALAYPPLALAIGLPATGIVLNFIVAALVFALGLYCFSKGWLSGGDVKLGSVTVMWLGMDLMAGFLLISALIGALVTLAALVGMRLVSRSGRGTAVLREDGVPYGPAIAGAGLLLLQVSPWMAALS